MQGAYKAELAADQNTMTGTWTQGVGSFPLILTRQATALVPPQATVDAAMPAVGIEQIQEIMDKDIAGALKEGALAPGTGAGVAVGVVQHGTRKLFRYGAVQVDSVFEIGSITKTMTATMLAQMVEQGKVRLDEPVRVLLPAGTVSKPSGAEIRLVDLSDQHSGLPRLPGNFAPADETNPYAGYDATKLYAFLGRHGVELPANAPFGYSNLGVGLLGQALANAAGTPYPELLSRELLGPLGMHDTGVALKDGMKTRFVQGHDAQHQPAHAWDLTALAGAGGVRSTAADMLIYLEAQLHPDHLPASASATSEGKTLPAAIARTHVLHGEAMAGTHIGLNWFRTDKTGSFWHNGGTGGFSSYAMFNPEGDFAVVVLCNTAPGNDGSFADLVGKHIAQRLEGREAVGLGVK